MAAKDENFLRARLPILCYELLGGTDDASIRAVTKAWNLLYDAISYLDTVIDDEVDSVDFLIDYPEPLPGQQRLGTVINLSTGLLARMGHALLSLNHHDPAPSRAMVEAICRRFFDSLETMSVGQQASIGLEVPTLEQAWAIAEAKAGACYVAGSWSAARLLTPEIEQLNQAATLGASLGIMAQIKDDIQGLWANNQRPSDISSGAWSLPITYSLSVLSEEHRADMRTLLEKSSNDSDAEQWVRERIVGTGALLYLGIELEKYRKRAMRCVQHLSRSQTADQTLKLLINRLGTLPTG